MDKVVVDSSVVIKWFVAEPHSSEARRLLDEYQQGALDFLGPDLLFAEIGNIVWKKQSFQGLSVIDPDRCWMPSVASRSRRRRRPFSLRRRIGWPSRTSVPSTTVCIWRSVFGKTVGLLRLMKSWRTQSARHFRMSCAWPIGRDVGTLKRNRRPREEHHPCPQ